MKRGMLSLAFAFMSFFALAQKGNFKMIANLEGTNQVTIEYVEEVPKRHKISETVTAKNGRIKFSTELPHAVKAEIKEISSGNSFFIYFVPGEELHLDGRIKTMRDRVNLKIGGSGFYRDLASIRAADLLFRLKDCELAERLAAGELTQDEYIMYLQAKNKKYDAWIVQYIMDHPNTLAVYSLTNIMAPWAETVYSLLGDAFKESPFALLLDRDIVYAQRINQQKQASRLQVASELEVGKPMPAFTLLQPNGKELNTSILHGKYAVMDFWGSWCTWCIKGFPKMTEFYKKHSDKVEFLSIACNDTDKKWREALAKYQLPWLQVFSPDGVVEKRYGIQVYPTKVVVSPDGTVLKIFQGENDDFYSYLKSLLK